MRAIENKRVKEAYEAGKTATYVLLALALYNIGEDYIAAEKIIPLIRAVTQEIDRLYSEEFAQDPDKVTIAAACITRLLHSEVYPTDKENKNV